MVISHSACAPPSCIITKHTTILIHTHVTRFYNTDPNHTSGKIKLTPPVNSYTIILVVLTLSPLKILEAGFNGRLLWVMCRARMVVLGLVKDLAWQESVGYVWTA